MTSEPIPVVPAAHYSCGGIATDDYGQTSVDRLRAVGEVACTGLQGANRLASTSLLECLVWGTRAGAQAAKRILAGNCFYFPQVADWRYENEPADPALIAQDWLTIQHTMWNYVGLIRSEKKTESRHAYPAGTGSGDRALLRQMRNQRFGDRPAQWHSDGIVDP